MWFLSWRIEAGIWNCRSETHESHASSHEHLYWFYHRVFEDKQSISVDVPVWDLHNWQIWHIWSFLLSSPLSSFSDLAAGDVYRTKLVDCAELWGLLTSFLPKSRALRGKRATHSGCRARWDGGETGREVWVRLGESLLIWWLDHLSLPLPKSSEAQPLLFLPQNCNSERVSPKYEWETVATITLLKKGH